MCALFRKEDVAYVDELVQDYLVWRGFTKSHKAFTNEIKNDKSHGYNATAVVEHLVRLVKGYELEELLGYWSFLCNQFFSRIQAQDSYSFTTTRLELSVKRYYLINAVSAGKIDKAQEFFELLGHSLSEVEEWRSWFSLPFVRDPQHSEQFAVYFTFKWRDNLIVSLTNFLSTIFANVPPPKILNFANEKNTQKELLEKLQLLTSGVAQQQHPSPHHKSAANLAPSPVKAPPSFEPTPPDTHWTPGQEIFSGHNAPVKRVRFSNNGDYVASGSTDGVVRVWSHIPAQSPNGNLFTYTNVESLCWSTTDRYLFVGGADSKCRIWAMNKQEVVGEITTAPMTVVNAVESSPFDPNLFITAASSSRSKKGVLQHWSLKSLSKPLRNFALDDSVSITCAAFNHNGNLLCTGGSDGMLRIFDFSLYAPILSWSASSGALKSVTINPDDNSVWSVDQQGAACLWSIHRPGEAHCSIEAPGGASSDNLAVDPSGTRVALGGGELALVYQVEHHTPRLAHRIQGHSARVTCVTWHPEKQVLISASEDRTCRIISLDDE